MEWVLDPVDDVELVRDIERVRSVGTEKKVKIEFHKMSGTISFLSRQPDPNTQTK